MLKNLWFSYRKWYINYLGLQNHKLETDRLSYYRDNLFISIFTLTIVLGAISYIPSITAAIILDKWFVFYADTIAFAVLLFAFFYKSFSLSIRKQVFTVTFFLLSFGLVLDLGLGGNGPILLFMLSVLVTLYSSTKSGVNSVLLTALFYSVVLLVKYFNIVEITFFLEGPFEGLVIVFTNNVIFSLLTVYSVSFLIKQLHKAFVKENQLQEMLKKEHEITINAKNEAERSNKLKTAFLSNMSHEIKTPMYGIVGSANLLKSNTDSNEENDQYFSIIEDNSNLLLNMFNDVLEISKLESGNVALNISSINIYKLIDDLRSEFAKKAMEKDIQLSVNFNCDTNYSLMSDEEKLKKTLSHIIDNAIKFSGHKSKVIIYCNYLNPNAIEFVIKDNGIGISKDQLNQVHLPFFITDLDNKAGIHGTGLGLAIAKAYIGNLGGQLHIKSELGEGTEVSFQLMDYNKKAP